MDELKGTATAEQIAGWKKKHGDVFEAKVDDSVCYLKKTGQENNVLCGDAWKQPGTR
jgi:hypothetical protein